MELKGEQKGSTVEYKRLNFLTNRQGRQGRKGREERNA